MHSNVSVTEIKATRVVNDRRLSQLARMKSAIEVVYHTSAPSTTFNGPLLLQETKNVKSHRCCSRNMREQINSL